MYSPNHPLLDTLKEDVGTYAYARLNSEDNYAILSTRYSLWPIIRRDYPIYPRLSCWTVTSYKDIKSPLDDRCYWLFTASCQGCHSMS